MKTITLTKDELKAIAISIIQRVDYLEDHNPEAKLDGYFSLFNKINEAYREEERSAE